MTMETIVLRSEQSEVETKSQPEETEAKYNDSNHNEQVTQVTQVGGEQDVEDNGSEVVEVNGDNGSSSAGHESNQELSDHEIEEDVVNDSRHAADEMKKRLEEMDPCEKLRALCKKGEVDELKQFLELKSQTGQLSSIIDYISSDGWTCLHEIITHGCQFTAVAKVLLQHGAKVDTTDFNLDTPLHASLLYHNTENTRLLLEFGADLNLANSKGRKPIHNANDVESLELLLDHGAHVDSQDANGYTPLHYAVMAKDLDRVKLLVKRQCDIKSANHSGSTALHLASDAEIARILLDSIETQDLTLTVNVVDQAGNSPLHLAVRGRHRETVRLLVAKNGQHDLNNASGKSPLSLAKDKEMKNILLKKDESPGSPALLTNVMKKNNKVGASNISTGPIVLPGNEKLQSPSILKRKRRHECATDLNNGHHSCSSAGPKLRFSDIIDYSGVEEEAPVSKRVRAAPLYTDFSSEDEEN